jgi:hypothetical protein
MILIDEGGQVLAVVIGGMTLPTEAVCEKVFRCRTVRASRWPESSCKAPALSAEPMWANPTSKPRSPNSIKTMDTASCSLFRSRARKGMSLEPALTLPVLDWSKISSQTYTMHWPVEHGQRGIDPTGLERLCDRRL